MLKKKSKYVSLKHSTLFKNVFQHPESREVLSAAVIGYQGLGKNSLLMDAIAERERQILENCVGRFKDTYLDLIFL